MKEVDNNKVVKKINYDKTSQVLAYSFSKCNVKTLKRFGNVYKRTCVTWDATNLSGHSVMSIFKVLSIGKH